MDSVLANFVRALRAAGTEPSVVESIDAVRAVALTGYADRARLKDVLGVVLAKSAEEKLIHDRVFDLYFAPPTPVGSAADDDVAKPATDAASPMTGDAEVDALVDLATPGADGRPSDVLRVAVARAARRAGVDEIRFATQAPYFARRTLEALGIAALEARLAQRGTDPSTADDPETQRLAKARASLQRLARSVVDERFELFGKPATESFLSDVAVTRPLGRMAPAEMERMKAAVARMAKKLAARHSRRQRQQLRGRLDFRRTMRANAGHDGMPFTLAWKQRRRDKPRIVAVCDVSGSVAAHVRLLLLFLYALHDVVGDLRSFAFSNRLQDVAAPLETLPFDDAMKLILKEVGSGSTDYGRAWRDLQERHGEAIDRRTTVIVMGDGRSNGTAPRLDLFKELAARAKRVLWLCPEPVGRWGTGDSIVQHYRPFCTRMSHCATVADLERTLEEALDAYH